MHVEEAAASPTMCVSPANDCPSNEDCVRVSARPERCGYLSTDGRTTTDGPTTTTNGRTDRRRRTDGRTTDGRTDGRADGRTTVSITFWAARTRSPWTVSLKPRKGVEPSSVARNLL